MYELPEAYDSIVSVNGHGLELSEYEKLNNRTIRFCKELPDELGCIRVSYTPYSTSCSTCKCGSCN